MINETCIPWIPTNSFDLIAFNEQLRINSEYFLKQTNDLLEIKKKEFEKDIIEIIKTKHNEFYDKNTTTN